MLILTNLFMPASSTSPTGPALNNLHERERKKKSNLVKLNKSLEQGLNLSRS